MRSRSTPTPQQQWQALQRRLSETSEGEKVSRSEEEHQTRLVKTRWAISVLTLVLSIVSFGLIIGMWVGWSVADQVGLKTFSNLIALHEPVKVSFALWIGANLVVRLIIHSPVGNELVFPDSRLGVWYRRLSLSLLISAVFLGASGTLVAAFNVTDSSTEHHVVAGITFGLSIWQCWTLMARRIVLMQAGYKIYGAFSRLGLVFNVGWAIAEGVLGVLLAADGIDPGVEFALVVLFLGDTIWLAVDFHLDTYRQVNSAPAKLHLRLFIAGLPNDRPKVYRLLGGGRHNNPGRAGYI